MCNIFLYSYMDDSMDDIFFYTIMNNIYFVKIKLVKLKE